MEADKFTIKIRLCPDDETMAVILAMLNMWQDAHPDLMVAMVPAEDRYQYEIIKSGRADQGDSGARSNMPEVQDAAVYPSSGFSVLRTAYQANERGRMETVRAESRGFDHAGGISENDGHRDDGILQKPDAEQR